LLIIAFLIVLISVTAGILAYIFTSGFENIGKSTWWAFLRLSDPGYLGDDEGVLLRTVSTVVTILGYVVFMGALIAIMTQWLHRTMRKLESGLTLRSGTSLRVEHLQRVDFMNAAVIILLGTDFTSEGSEVVDTRVVKTLMTISNHAIQRGIGDPPLVVAEIFDARKIMVAKAAYQGEK
jgi:hypothetical protein